MLISDFLSLKRKTSLFKDTFMMLLGFFFHELNVCQKWYISSLSSKVGSSLVQGQMWKHLIFSFSALSSKSKRKSCFYSIFLDKIYKSSLKKPLSFNSIIGTLKCCLVSPETQSEEHSIFIILTIVLNTVSYWLIKRKFEQKTYNMWFKDRKVN